MINTIAAGLALALTAQAPDTTGEHSTRFEHPLGTVEVQYRGDVRVVQKQVGSVAPGGRPSTLRCSWTAQLAVNREARTAMGRMTSRQFIHESIASGSRVGWCRTNKTSISKELAKQTQDLRKNLVEVAEKDRPALIAEIDRLHEKRPAG